MSIYFARCEDGMIKIGTSEHPWFRATVQQKLELLAVLPGGYREEFAQHRCWSRFREERRRNGEQRREYFYPKLELLDYIAAIPAVTPVAAYEVDIARRGRGRERAARAKMKQRGFIDLSEVLCEHYFLYQSIRAYIVKKRVRTLITNHRIYVQQDDCAALISELTTRMKRPPKKENPMNARIEKQNRRAKVPAHEYTEVDLTSWAECVAAANPGQHIVRVDDEYGTDVVPMRKLPLSNDERDAVLAGDSTTLLDGSRVQLLRRAS